MSGKGNRLAGHRNWIKGVLGNPSIIQSLYQFQTGFKDFEGTSTLKGLNTDFWDELKRLLCPPDGKDFLNPDWQAQRQNDNFLQPVRIQVICRVIHDDE